MRSLTKNHVTLLGVSLIAVGLGACSTPNSLPRGYTYQHQEFKSPNPAPSRKVTKESRKYMGAEQAEQFRYAVYDLVTKLTDRAGLPPKATYVLQPDPMTPFYGNLDNDMRESLRHTGYTLADTPNGAYVMTYVATLIEKPEMMQDMPVTNSDPNVTISLYVYDSVGENARMLTEQTGNYYIQGAEALHVPYANFKGVPTPQEAKEKQTMPEPEPQPVMGAPEQPAYQPAPPAPSEPAMISREPAPEPEDDMFTPEPVVLPPETSYQSYDETPPESSYQSSDDVPAGREPDGYKPPFYSNRPRVSKHVDLDE